MMYLPLYYMRLLHLYVESQVLVIVACASLDRLDAALIRPGRLALHYHLTYPCLDDLYEIAAAYLAALGGLVDGGDRELTAQKIVSLLLPPLPPPPNTAATTAPFIFGDVSYTNNNKAAMGSCSGGSGGVIGGTGRLLTGSDVVALFQRAKLVAMRECIQHIDHIQHTNNTHTVCDGGSEVHVEYKIRYIHFL